MSNENNNHIPGLYEEIDEQFYTNPLPASSQNQEIYIGLNFKPKKLKINSFLDYVKENKKRSIIALIAIFSIGIILILALVLIILATTSIIKIF